MEGDNMDLSYEELDFDLGEDQGTQNCHATHYHCYG
jgi:hypothetical protein